jgi:hypothetical protein
VPDLSRPSLSTPRTQPMPAFLASQRTGSGTGCGLDIRADFLRQLDSRLQVCVRAEDDQDVVGASKRRVNQVHLTKKSKSQGSLDYGTLLADGVRGWEAG